MAEEVRALSISVDFDQQLAREDIEGSRAHVQGLAHSGLISEDDAQVIFKALDQVHGEFTSGAFVFVEDDEDVHTAIERRVIEIAGEAGAKLHTARSRNDQVATDMRLWCRRAMIDTAAEVLTLQEVLRRRAVEAGDIYLPGYTHMQRAQAVLLSHHLLAHGWALARDIDRLVVSIERLNVSPLGAGALAGSSLPVDPDFVAHQLGFTGRFENSLDAVSDRDFVAELLFDLALLGVHLSRLGEELVLWSSDEFGFCTLDDAFATGSSMLPQKKNPDVAELVRGKSGRLIGYLTGLLATLKSLPLAYNRDLQEDKEPAFDAVTQVQRALAALSGVVASLRWHEERMRNAADEAATSAVDLAEWLVERGMPFRRAHTLVGGLVRESVERRVPLAELVQGNPQLGDEAVALLRPGVAITRRTTPGGAGPQPVAAQLQSFNRRLEVDRARIGALPDGEEAIARSSPR